MTIKIVLPEGDGVKSTNGIKVFTESGHQINGVTNIKVDWSVNNIIQAVITVAVSEIENLEGIEGIVIVDKDEEKT